MGRPIKKFWTTGKAGSIGGNLRLLCNTGSEETTTIQAQVGTGKYRVDTSNATTVVKLVNKTSSPLEGEGILLIDGVPVRKLNQYRAYFFDGSDAIWRDGDGNVIGTFSPALSVENDEPGAPADSQAVLTVTVVQNGVDDWEVTDIAITDAGYGYDSAPTITLTSSAQVAATATCTINGLGQINSVTITNGGSYTDAEQSGGITATVPAP